MKTLKRFSLDLDQPVSRHCPVTRFNLANSLATQVRHEEAVAKYRELADEIESFPWLPLNLGASLVALGRWEEAVGAFEWATRTVPNDPLSHGNLGAALGYLGRSEEALPYLCQAVQLAPDDLNALLNLVRALHALRHPDAIKVADMATRMASDNPETWRSYGDVLLLFGASEDALAAYRKAEELASGCLNDSNNFGLALLRTGYYQEAIEFIERAVQTRPDAVDTWAELGLTQLQGGEVAEAVANLRHSTELLGENEFIHSNLLLGMCYSPEYSPADLLEEAQRWSARYAPIGGELPAAPVRNRTRRRIGFLSADYHEHPAGLLYEALFPLLDRSRFEVIAYSTKEFSDEVTRCIQASVDGWAVVHGDTDDELAARIRADEIDILIDLQGHTPGHRLKALRRRPAPVQATWLGYFGTTGMTQMDFILADRCVLPEEHEVFFTERPARTEGCLYVFQPPKLAIPVGASPVSANGFVTFGCFNNVAKISAETIALWGDVLRAVPDARMVLNRWPLDSERARAKYAALFAAQGIDPSRIDFRATKGREKYLRSYHDVDLMLDTTPFGGGTTTSEALWMGVPVVALSSDRFPGRMSESILRAVGLPELVSADPADYVRRAIALAGDLPRLAAYRETLRGRVEGSPLCDVPGYARQMESVFDWMWANK